MDGRTYEKCGIKILKSKDPTMTMSTKIQHSQDMTKKREKIDTVINNMMQ